MNNAANQRRINRINDIAELVGVFRSDMIDDPELYKALMRAEITLLHVNEELIKREMTKIATAMFSEIGFDEAIERFRSLGLPVDDEGKIHASYLKLALTGAHSNVISSEELAKAHGIK